MREKYIILRAGLSPTRGERARGASDSAAAKLSIEIDDNRRNVAKLAREPNVRCVARSIPIKLIRPLSVQATSAAPTNIAWGIRAVGADTSPFDGENVTVAVLDTGIDPEHPAFEGVRITRKNFTQESDVDLDGHGTHCAGTIFGQKVGNVRVGIAPNVKQALIGKVLGADGGDSEQIIRGIQWAVENGANVISMSIGMDFPGLVAELQHEQDYPPELATSVALEGYRTNVLMFECLASLIRLRPSFNGATLLVAAAGNESRRDVDARFEIGVSPPAVSEGIISVAAVGQNGAGLAVAPFSNTGAAVSGPGVDIVSAAPGGGWATMSGTSMATPHVAGVAALWADKIRRGAPLSALELMGRLVGTAVIDGLVPGFDPSDIGAGLVRAPQT